MRPREGFQQKAIGICPTEQDLKDQTIKQTEEEGMDIRDHTVLEMKAGFSLPDAGDLLEEVLFTEPRREAADRLARPPSEEGRGAGPPPRGALTTGLGWLPGRGGSGGSQRCDNRGAGAGAGGNRGGFQS